MVFKLRKETPGVPWWPSVKGFGIVTAVMQVQPLAWELVHATGTVPPLQKNPTPNDLDYMK